MQPVTLAQTAIEEFSKPYTDAFCEANRSTMSSEEAAKRLQYDLGLLDLLSRSSRSGREAYVELMVVKLAPLKIKIYPEDGPHKEPHVHID